VDTEGRGAGRDQGESADNVVRFPHDRLRGRRSRDRRPGSAQPIGPDLRAEPPLAQDGGSPASADDFWSGELPFDQALPAEPPAAERAPAPGGGAAGRDGEAANEAASRAAPQPDVPIFASSLYMGDEDFVPIGEVAPGSSSETHTATQVLGGPTGDEAGSFVLGRPSRQPRVSLRRYIPGLRRPPRPSFRTAAILVAAVLLGIAAVGYALGSSGARRVRVAVARHSAASPAANPLAPLTAAEARRGRASLRSAHAAHGAARSGRRQPRQHAHSPSRTRAKVRTLSTETSGGSLAASSGTESAAAADRTASADHGPAASGTYAPATSTHDSSSTHTTSSPSKPKPWGYGGALGAGSSPSG
jgi:hypothetical protein